MRAAFGRRDVAWTRSDTNNLIESYHNQAKHNLAAGRRFGRLDQLLAFLCNTVFPWYFIRRQHRVSGAERSGAGRADLKHDTAVGAYLAAPGKLTVTDASIGCACCAAVGAADLTKSHVAVLGDGSCECLENRKDVCAHVEALSRLPEEEPSCRLDLGMMRRTAAELGEPRALA